MCWSEPVSYLTFALGTVFNIASYAYLRCMKSVTAPLVWYWQFALLMQLPEGVVWSQLRVGGDVAAASHAAMILNILQPIVLTITVWLGCGRRPLYALVATLMYILLIGADGSSMWRDSRSIEPEAGCAHLDLRYWNGARTTLFVFASFFSFCAIPSVAWAAINSTFFIATLLISVGAYHCGGGSMWCWMIFLAGLVLALCDVGLRILFGAQAERILRAEHISFAPGFGDSRSTTHASIVQSITPEL